MLRLLTEHTYWLWFLHSDTLCLSELRETLIHYQSFTTSDCLVLCVWVWLTLSIASFRAAIFTFLPIIRHRWILLIALTPRVLSLRHNVFSICHTFRNWLFMIRVLRSGVQTETKRPHKIRNEYCTQDIIPSTTIRRSTNYLRSPLVLKSPYPGVVGIGCLFA